MKSADVVAFAFLFSTIALPAQTSTPGASTAGVAQMEDLSGSGTSNQKTVLQGTAPYHACPVSLRAQHGASGEMRQADRSRAKGPGQLLHLTLFNPAGQQIVSARVQVHGLSGAARTTQANSKSAKPDATQSLGVRFSPDSAKTVTGDLWVPAMTAVLTVDLDSVTFADGSTRTFTRQDACRVAPDLRMLIADR